MTIKTTKPSAGALRAAIEVRRQFNKGKQVGNFDAWAADIIDRETGVGELLEIAKLAHTSLRTFSDHVPEDEKMWTSFDSQVLERLEQAIAKTEGKC